MTISREEIAVHCLASLLTRDGYDGAGAARDAVVAADALLLALTPAPVAPPAGPCPGEDARDDAEARKRIAAYVPKAGDVVTLTTDKAACVVRVALNADEYAMVYGDHNTGTFRFDTFGRGKYVYLRDATDAEKRAAGLAVPPQATATCPGCGSENRSVRGWIRVRRVDDLNSDALLASEDFPVSHRTIRTVRCTARFHTSPPATTPVPEVLTPDVPEGSTIAQLAAEQRASMGLTASMGSTQHFTHAATPAPEAKRPTLADVERSAEAFANHKGDIPHSPSDAWMDGWLARDRAVAHDGIAHSTNALCPPPVAGSGATLPDNVREFLLDVEYAAKWANQPQGPAIEYVKGRLKELAARAHDILTSPVRP